MIIEAMSFTMGFVFGGLLGILSMCMIVFGGDSYEQAGLADPEGAAEDGDAEIQALRQL